MPEKGPKDEGEFLLIDWANAKELEESDPVDLIYIPRILDDDY